MTGGSSASVLVSLCVRHAIAALKFFRHGSFGLQSGVITQTRHVALYYVELVFHRFESLLGPENRIETTRDCATRRIRVLREAKVDSSHILVDGGGR